MDSIISSGLSTNAFYQHVHSINTCILSTNVFY